MFWKTLVVSLLSLASLAQADVVIRDVDVRAIPDLNQPGQAWERISSLDYHVFKGLNRPLIRVKGSKKSWVLNGTRLEEWPHAFPTASFLTQVVELPDETLIGGPSGNHLRFIKSKEDPFFRLMAEAADLYWIDHVEGSDVVFAKRSKTGPLLILEGETLSPSPLPEKGSTKLGEFLPWYSQALNGYFTVSATDIWFYRWNDPNGPDWRPVIQEQPRSWANSWGLSQRGSQEILSPSGSLLKVISKNQNHLSQYHLSHGTPTTKLPSLNGRWYQTGETGEIVGWLGPSSRVLLSAEDREKIEARTPQFVRIPPNSNTPEPFPNLRPLPLSYNNTSIHYDYGFATMPGTDRLYFLHENGFAYYSAGTVTRLPAAWLDTVGALPRFLANSQSLYVAAHNGLYRLNHDDTLIKIVPSNSKNGYTDRAQIFDLGCAQESIVFLGWKTGIYALDPMGPARLILQSNSPIRVYGTTPDSRSVLFSQKEGGLKLLSAAC